MRVLLNAGPWLPVPPDGYGGIETVLATLVPPLRAAGIHVTLAGVAGSQIEVDQLVATVDEPRFAEIARPYNQTSGIALGHMHKVIRLVREQDFDLVHDHQEVVGVAMLAAIGTQAPPVLQTLHWDMRKHPDFYEVFDGAGRVAFAAVSQSQLDRAPQAICQQTIGVVPLAAPTPLPAEVPKGDHVLVLARITRDKGQDIAARVCAAAGIPLVIAGPVAGIGDPAELHERIDRRDERLVGHPDVQYYVEQIRPLLAGSDQIRWVGGVAGETKERLLRGARCLLVPNRWAEPGATGVVEALLRGVPVVATPLGVLPSLVADGVTGFLAADEEQLAAALGRLDEIDPNACRYAARDCTPEVMAGRYLDLYDKLLRSCR